MANKERSISSSVLSSSVRPAALVRKQRPDPSSSLPNWLKCLPFIGLHLACLAVLFTGVDATAILLCAVFYFVAHVRHHGRLPSLFRAPLVQDHPRDAVPHGLPGCSAFKRDRCGGRRIIAQHHRFSDTPDDPHSPHVTSFWWSHLGWILSEDHVETPWDAIRDWARYPELRWLDRCTGCRACCWPSRAS